MRSIAINSDKSNAGGLMSLSLPQLHEPWRPFFVEFLFCILPISLVEVPCKIIQAVPGVCDQQWLPASLVILIEGYESLVKHDVGLLWPTVCIKGFMGL